MVKKKAVKKSMGVRENSYSLLELNRSLSSKFKQRIRNSESITLEFNLNFQDNSLSYDDSKENAPNQRQIILHSLIFYMYEERGMSYRKISKWLNRSGIKTHQGNTWGESGNSVYSVLKRMKEREKRVLEKRFTSESEIKNFKITHNQKNI